MGDEGSVSKPRVLIVDNDPAARMRAQRLLTAEGIRSETVADAEVALALLALRSQTDMPFDAVITDDRMPFMTGWELMEHVARDHPTLVRVIASGYENALHETERAHIPHWFLPKPLSGANLALALRSSLRARDRRSQ